MQNSVTLAREGIIRRDNGPANHPRTTRGNFKILDSGPARSVPVGELAQSGAECSQDQ